MVLGIDDAGHCWRAVVLVAGVEGVSDLVTIILLSSVELASFELFASINLLVMIFFSIVTCCLPSVY